jgi:hypothetical protein
VSIDAEPGTRPEDESPEELLYIQHTNLAKIRIIEETRRRIRDL